MSWSLKVTMTGRIGRHKQLSLDSELRTLTGNRPVAYARSTERDRIVSVKSDDDYGASDGRRAERAMLLDKG